MLGLWALQGAKCVVTKSNTSQGNSQTKHTKKSLALAINKEELIFVSFTYFIHSQPHGLLYKVKPSTPASLLSLA